MHTTTTAVTGGITAPRGFRASGLHCGIKANGKHDVALLVSDTRASAAGITNRLPPPASACTVRADTTTVGAHRRASMSLASAELESQQVIGSVAEGTEMVHVVTRNVGKVETLSMTKVEAITLRRTELGWRLALTGDLEGLAETLQASIAPAQDPAAGEDIPSP